MKKKFFIAITLLALGTTAFVIKHQSSWEARVTAAVPGEPCPASTARTYPAGYYTGPLYDTHVHIPPIPDGPVGGDIAELLTNDRPALGVNITIDDIVCTLRTEGTKKIFAFFPVWKELIAPMVDVVERSVALYPEQFAPFIMPPDHDNSPDGFPTVDAETLQAMLDASPDLFAGYGEIGLYERAGGLKDLPPDSDRLLAIYPVLQSKNLLVYVHLGREHQEAFERVADLYPDVHFIFHGDQLIPYREGGRQDLSVIDAILSNHPNVSYGVDELYGDIMLLSPDVSKDKLIAHFADYETLLAKDLGTWKAFIEKHPKQVLWGTDRGASVPWSFDQDIGFLLTDYTRAFIGRLSPAVQEDYAYKNAERLLNN